jgi:tetratricopeptide (TPR) repeat protein
MSLKENVDYVKQELNSEEKFLEGFVKVERFYKKYKTLILGLIAILIIAGIALVVKSNIDESNKLEANLAFEKILKNPEDKDAMAKLKETNTNLYNIATYLVAKDKGELVKVNVPYLKELATYQEAVKNNSISELNNVSMENNFLLKEFAIFNKALLLANEGKFEEAKTTLNLIPNTSKANDLANLLNHYLVTK